MGAHTHTTPKPIIFAKHNIIYIFIQRIYILTCSVSYRVEPYLIIYDHAPTKKKLIFKHTKNRAFAPVSAFHYFCQCRRSRSPHSYLIYIQKKRKTKKKTLICTFVFVSLSPDYSYYQSSFVCL